MSTTTTTADLKNIQQLLDKTNQSHLLNFYPQLSQPEQEALLTQIAKLNLERCVRCFKVATTTGSSTEGGEIAPPPATSTQAKQSTSAQDLARFYQLGLNAIAKNQVAVILLAGGQGTRLGSDLPKGCFKVGLPSDKSLFELQADRLRQVQAEAQALTTSPVLLPWYVMTSPSTRAETIRHFEQAAWYGLQREQISFFDQGVMPCFDFEGGIFLQEPGVIASAGDGNGGIYRALLQEGVLQKMTAQGIQHVHVYSVDNCLVRVADPLFIGYCMAERSDCAAKVVRKMDPEESVGVIAYHPAGQTFNIVEYSEISKQQREQRDASDPSLLAYRGANICNHYYTLEFLTQMAEESDNLPFHVAKKKIPHVDPSGQAQKPTQPNGIKLEQFIFDVFPLSKRFRIWEVLREEEFSPLKNANKPGATDCPDTCKKDLLNLHRSWLIAAGALGVEGLDIELHARIARPGLEELVKGKRPSFISTPIFVSTSEQLKDLFV